VNQILPGYFYGFLDPGNLPVVSILEFLDAMFELGKPRANVLKFPIVLKLYVDLLPCKAILQKRYTGRQILYFPNGTLEISFFKLHGFLALLKTAPEKSGQWGGPADGRRKAGRAPNAAVSKSKKNSKLVNLRRVGANDLWVGRLRMDRVP